MIYLNNNSNYNKKKYFINILRQANRRKNNIVIYSMKNKECE
jgi:hypothetical protein